MITLLIGQSMLNNPNYVVYEGNNYNDTDLVQVCHIDNPGLPVASYQAFFIKNGYDYASDIPASDLKLKIGVENPLIVDYDIMGFQKKRTLTKGDLSTIEYYKDYDGVDYTDLIIKETRVYNRDVIGIIQHRDVLIEWYSEDGNVGLTKSWRKYYSPEEAINEGIDRRCNMISMAKTVLLYELKLVVGEPTNQQYAFDLLTTLTTQIKYFEEGYTQPLRDAVNNSTRPYLNNSIKSKLIVELTF